MLEQFQCFQLVSVWSSISLYLLLFLISMLNFTPTESPEAVVSLQLLCRVSLMTLETHIPFLPFEAAEQ